MITIYSRECLKHVPQKLHGKLCKSYFGDNLLSIQRLRVDLAAYASPFWINRVKINSGHFTPLSMFLTLSKTSFMIQYKIHIFSLIFEREIYLRKKKLLLLLTLLSSFQPGSQSKLHYLKYARTKCGKPNKTGQGSPGETTAWNGQPAMSSKVLFQQFNISQFSFYSSHQ